MVPEIEVLVADGDPSVRGLLEVIVRLLPAHPIVAGDGRSALELLVARSFDAIVLELMLPEVEGTEILEFLGREKPEMLPHVVIVTTVPERRWQTCRELNRVAAVIRKPFALQELQSAIRDCCARLQA